MDKRELFLNKLQETFKEGNTKLSKENIEFALFGFDMGSLANNLEEDENITNNKNTRRLWKIHRW